MSKIKTRPNQPEPEDSISISKYLAFEDPETSLQQPTPNHNHSGTHPKHPESPPKIPKLSTKKKNKSTKKQNILSDQEEKGQPAGKRKLKPKKNLELTQVPEKLPSREKENENADNHKQKSAKKPHQKKQRSQRKVQNKPKQQPELKVNPNNDEQNFNQKNLSQASNGIQVNQNSANQESKESKIFQSQDSEESFNFNRRLKKSKHVKKQEIDAIFSGYAQDDESLNNLKRTQNDDDSNYDQGKSDLTDYELYNNKKQKKPKKDEGPKVKNKFFKDIQCSTTLKQEEVCEAEDPPEDCVELVVQNKEPRKTLVNFEKIQRKAAHVKDKRQMKATVSEFKLKNQLKETIREVKDADQINIDVIDPKLAGKKGASGALQLKKNIEKKIYKNNQSQNSSTDHSPLAILQKESKLQRTNSNLDEKLRKEQEYILKERKKGIDRDEFEKRLIQDIKLKKQTTLTSQEVVENIKSTSLDDADFDIDLAEDVMSNCSSRSGSQMKDSRQDRRMSVDSQNSRRSQDSLKSRKSNQGIQERPVISSVIVEINDSENSLPSVSMVPSFHSHVPSFQSVPVIVSEPESVEIVQTSKSKTKYQEMMEYQEEEDRKLLEKKKKKYEETVAEKENIDELLGENKNEEKSKKNKKYKKSKKTKKSNFSIETYFQEEAEYSSSEEGHTDESDNQENENDLDADGNLKDMLDENSNIAYNEKAVRKKFLEDQAKRQLEDMERIIKKMKVGRQRGEDTESQKKRRKRMEEAAQRNRLKDLLLDDQNQVEKPVQATPNSVEIDIDQDDEDEQKNMKKIQDLEQQILYGNRLNPDEADGIPVNRQLNSIELFNFSLPESDKNRVSKLNKKIPNPRMSMPQRNRPKNSQAKKLMIDLKKNDVERQIHKKRKTVQKRGESTGNRNKLQKTSGIDIGIRSKAQSQDEQLDI